MRSQKPAHATPGKMRSPEPAKLQAAQPICRLHKLQPARCAASSCSYAAYRLIELAQAAACKLRRLRLQAAQPEPAQAAACRLRSFKLQAPPSTLRRLQPTGCAASRLHIYSLRRLQPIGCAASSCRLRSPEPAQTTACRLRSLKLLNCQLGACAGCSLQAAGASQSLREMQAAGCAASSCKLRILEPAHAAAAQPQAAGCESFGPAQAAATSCRLCSLACASYRRRKPEPAQGTACRLHSLKLQAAHLGAAQAAARRLRILEPSRLQPAGCAASSSKM